MTVMNKHFNQRCAERGITTTDADALYDALVLAVAGQRDDLAEFVMRSEDGEGEFWRFRCADGIFYALIKGGRPVTIYTQRMINSVKWKRKAKKKNKFTRLK